MSFSTNLKGAMIHARRWIPSNTKKRISSIRSSIPKASKTLFGKRSKRAKRTIAYKLSTANITSLCNFRKLSIFLFALVWYRCLAARLFEIFHHFGYLKSKYPESIANPFPPLLWRLEPEEHRRITIKIYFCTHYYTREAPQLLCFVRSIIFRCLKNGWHEWIHFLRTWNENSKLWTKKGIVYSRSTDKKFYTFNQVYENEKLCLIISKNRWKRFIPFTVAQDRDGFKLILSREWKAPSTPLYYTSLSQLYTSRKYFTGKKPCLIKITLEEAISLDTRGNA